MKTPKRVRTIQERTIFAISRNGQVLLRKRPEKGLLAGLYELPGTEGYLGAAEALDWLGVKEEEVELLEPLPEAKHVFSHVEWRMKGYLIRLKADVGTEAGFFVESETAQEVYALPGAFRAYAKYLFPG